MFEDQYYYSYYLTELYSSSGIGSFLLNRFTSKSARPSTSTAFYNYTIFENQYDYSYYTIGLDSSLGIGSFLLNRFTSKSARPSTPTVSYTPYYQSRGIGVSNLSKSVRNIYTSVSSNLYNYYSSEQLGIGSFLLDYF